MGLMIIIPSFNKQKLTQKAIESCLDKARDFELVVVHDGSSQECVHHLKKSYPQLTHLVREQNGGFTCAVNLGLDWAFKEKNYKWAMIFSNDVHIQKWHPWDEAKAPGIYAPCLMLRQTNRVHSLGGVFYPMRAKIEHLLDQHQWPKIKARTYIPGAAFIIHRDCYLSCGPWDESLGSYWEDVDYSQKARSKNFHLGLFPPMVLGHGVSKTTGKKAYYTTYLFQRNRFIISLRYIPSALRLIYRAYFSALSYVNFIKFKTRHDSERANYWKKIVKEIWQRNLT